MRRKERGYALLLAIFVVAGLSFAALAAARAQADTSAALGDPREREALAMTEESVASRLAFALMTEAIGPRSLLIARDARGQVRELRLDGRFYSLHGGGLRIAVQDEAGLLNLNGADQAAIAALVSASNSRLDAGALAAALLDFTDADAREEGDRTARSLASPAQALEASGWRAVEGARFWNAVTTAAETSAMNVNTAPADVLRAVLANPGRAEEILARREAAPILDVSEIEALAGGPGRAESAAFFTEAGRIFRIRIAQADSSGFERRLKLNVEEGADRPFAWIEERRGRLGEVRNGGEIELSAISTSGS